jgi:hypothetical protein
MNLLSTIWAWLIRHNQLEYLKMENYFHYYWPAEQLAKSLEDPWENTKSGLLIHYFDLQHSISAKDDATVIITIDAGCGIQEFQWVRKGNRTHYYFPRCCYLFAFVMLRYLRLKTDCFNAHCYWYLSPAAKLGKMDEGLLLINCVIAAERDASIVIACFIEPANCSFNVDLK